MRSVDHFLYSPDLALSLHEHDKMACMLSIGVISCMIMHFHILLSMCTSNYYLNFAATIHVGSVWPFAIQSQFDILCYHVFMTWRNGSHPNASTTIRSCNPVCQGGSNHRCRILQQNSKACEMLGHVSQLGWTQYRKISISCICRLYIIKKLLNCYYIIKLILRY